MGGEELRQVIFTKLERIFGKDEVFTRKRAATGSSDDFNASDMYNPELDICVRPENTNRDITENNNLMESALAKHDDILKKLNDIAEKRFFPNALNRNPRFFLAIEVAGSGSKKHLLGEMFNAAILGKIGIVVAANKTVLDSYIRHVKYINFAYGVGKIQSHFNNLMIIKGDKLLDFLEDYSQRSNTV